MEHIAHIPLTRDELTVAIAALEAYAKACVQSSPAGETSSSAAVARETVRRMRQALSQLA